MKIGRNDPCPCGSGKKYKKCCLNKQEKNDFNINDFIITKASTAYKKDIKEPLLNQKLLDIYEKNLSIKDITNNYLEVMNYILEYANKNNIKDIDTLSKECIIDEFILNVIGDFDMHINELDSSDCDFEIIIDYLDKLANTLNLDDNTYENTKRTKTNCLFKIGRYDEGEKEMLDLINKNNNSIYPYMQLVDSFIEIGNMEKAKYYYNLGMKQTHIKDIKFLEDMKDYLK